MKKSLIALAVAGAFAAPAFAATGNVDVYGVMNIAIQDTDGTGIDAAIVDNTSRIGFKGAEDLGGGLKAVWQIESAINVTSGSTTLAGRNSFIGLAGDFGTVVMGRHDTPYKLGTGKLDIFGDTIADYNGGAQGGGLDGMDILMKAHDARVGQALAYISPTWSGFHFAVAGVMDEETAPGVGTGLGSDDFFDALSATGVYVNGPLFASLSYQSVEALDSDAWKVGAAYTFGDTTVGAAYENVETGSVDRDAWLLNVVHAMGPIALKAQYGSVDDNGSDESLWALGADYSLSKRTTAYVVYGVGDNDIGDDMAGWNIGMKHTF